MGSLALSLPDYIKLIGLFNGRIHTSLIMRISLFSDWMGTDVLQLPNVGQTFISIMFHRLVCW